MNYFAAALALGGLALAASAASFQNLGFDLANTNSLVLGTGPPVSGTGPTEDLLPGWQLTKGGVPQSTVGLNLGLLSSGYATLISADQSDSFQLPVHGRYGLYLVGTAGNQEPFALSQRGDIPAGSALLTFTYTGYGFLLSINGQSQQASMLTPTVEAFNVSQFSGQTVDFTLTALGPLMPTQIGSSYIDNLVFTVPEPSTLALLTSGLALSAFALALWRFLNGPHPLPLPSDAELGP